MAEYIEREAAARMAVEAATEIFDCHTTLPLLKVANKIRTIPTADVVEVVRCCDCKHKQENPDINNTCYLTCNLKYGLKGTIDPTDFCSYGQKKEGETE